MARAKASALPRKWNRAFASDENFGTQTSGDAIASLVREEIANTASVENRWHGVTRSSLDERLATPARLERFASASGNGRFAWLWVVFDERPSRPGGYLIVYSERTKTFGLALKPGPPSRYGVWLGGGDASFVDALRGM